MYLSLFIYFLIPIKFAIQLKTTTVRCRLNVLCKVEIDNINMNYTLIEKR